MKKIFLSLFFVTVFTPSVFANAANLNDNNLNNQHDFKEEFKNLSTQITDVLNNYKKDRNKEKACSCLTKTRNNMLSNVTNNNEKINLHQLDEYFKDNDNFIPVNSEMPKISFSDKIFYLTLKALSPAAVLALATIIITRSIERIISSGEILKIIDKLIEFYHVYLYSTILKTLSYCLPLIASLFYNFQ